jgi:hypothetical protein
LVTLALTSNALILKTILGFRRSFWVTYDERQAWIELWRAVFGEPPAIEVESELAARILVDCLPPVLPYEFKSRTE